MSGRPAAAALNPSATFVRRPVATTLLAIGLLLLGLVAYRDCPSPACHPSTFRRSASARAGRAPTPEVMAESVAAPLERRLGAIPGVTEVTSTSTLGSTSIAVQFDLARPIDRAAQDVQAAINAAMTDLPSDMPTLPSFRKANPAAQPVIILVLTSTTRNTSEIYDLADSILVQRLSQVDGVAEVAVAGSEQPAVRVEFDPAAIAAAGLTIEQVRAAVVNANALGPTGELQGAMQRETIRLTGQLRTADDYSDIVTGRAPACCCA